MSLHMLQLALETRALAVFAHARGVPAEDEGYVLHRALREAFGGWAPQPFRLLAGTSGAPARILGYAPHDHAPLAEALAVQPPDVEALFPEVASKRMPASFAQGAAYGFEARVCPIARTSCRGDSSPGGRELDAFLHAALARPGEPVEREAVYRDWLARRLAAGGAELLDAGLHRLDQVPLVRRSHAAADGSGEDGPPRRLQRREGRRPVMARRPDATFRGNLRVADPDRFRDLLARGVGRHRAFGFGMLLLRPPGRA